MNLPTSPDEEEADKFVAAAASVEAQMESIKVENESYWAEVASVTAENERRRAEVRSLREGRPHRALALTRARMAGDEVEAAALEAKIRAQDMKIQLARAEDTRSGVDATTTSLMPFSPLSSSLPSTSPSPSASTKSFHCVTPVFLL